MEQNMISLPSLRLRWMFRRRSRRIASTEMVEPVRIDTVYLGASEAGSPVYETAIFGGRYDGYERRYRTYGAAIVGHHETVRMAARRVGDTR